MRGSIQKKGKIYYAVVAIGQKRKWIRAGPERSDAQMVLAEKLAEIVKGTYREAPKATFGEFSELWLKTHAEVNVKPSTLASYRDIISRLLIPFWGHFSLSHLSAIHFQQFISERFKTVSPKTACNEIALIKEMFKHAHRWGYVRNNPAEHLERPKVVRPEIEILNPDEVGKLLAHTTAHYRLAFLTGVLSGLELANCGP